MAFQNNGLKQLILLKTENHIQESLFEMSDICPCRTLRRSLPIFSKLLCSGSKGVPESHWNYGQLRLWIYCLRIGNGLTALMVICSTSSPGAAMTTYHQMARLQVCLTLYIKKVAGYISVCNNIAAMWSRRL